MKLKPGTYRWERTHKNPLRFARDKLLEIPKPLFLPTFHITIRIGRFSPDGLFDHGESTPRQVGRVPPHGVSVFWRIKYHHHHHHYFLSQVPDEHSHHYQRCGHPFIFSFAVVAVTHIFKFFFFFPKDKKKALLYCTTATITGHNYSKAYRVHNSGYH